MTADQRELYDERVAIMVIDGGLTVYQAEHLASKCIMEPVPTTEPAPIPEQQELFRGQMKNIWSDY